MEEIGYTYKGNKWWLLGCFLLWLFFPLLLLVLPRPFRSFWTRLALFLFSPMVIILGIEGYNYLERRYKYSQEEIERIIGMELPEYKVVNYEEKELNTHLVLGHQITKKLEFIQLPQQSFYNKLDSLCNLSDNEWTTVEYTSILDSLIKSNEMDWTEYLIGDRKEEIDSTARKIMSDQKIVPSHYKFSENIRLYINKGDKCFTLEYSDLELQETFRREYNH